MQQILLNATYRENLGKSATRKLRYQGRIPAIIYSSGQQAYPLSVSITEFKKILQQVFGNFAFLLLTIDENKKRMAILKKITFDHMNRRIMHIDFYEVQLDQKITLKVPIEYIGEANGIKAGGILNIANYSVTLRGFIKDLPDSFIVDVNKLELGQSIYLSDICLPPNIEALGNIKYLLASCITTTKIETDLTTSETEIKKGALVTPKVTSKSAIKK